MEFLKNMNKLAGKPFWVGYNGDQLHLRLCRIRYDPKENRYVVDNLKIKFYESEVKQIFLKLRELNDQIIGAE